MILYGVAGTNGSGKDTLCQLLAERNEFLFVSVTDMLRNEAAKRVLPIEREVLRTISAEWRREQGLGVLVDKSLDFFESQGGSSKYNGLVMASMRNPGEADRVHGLNGFMIWTDADPAIRYKRIFDRQRTSEDNKTFEQFLEEEKAEMSSSGDSATLNMAAVKEKCDIFVNNYTDDIETFYAEIVKQLGL